MTAWNQFKGDPQHSGRRRDFEGPHRVSERWTADLVGPAGAPVIDRDTVFVGTSEGNCYALERDTGRRRWTFETTAATDASPVVTRGALYLGTDDGIVRALDPATGDRRWETAVPDADAPSLALADDRLYVGHAAGVSALETDAGEVVWTHETDAPVGSPPAVADGTDRDWADDRVFVGTGDGTVVALAAADGEERWAVPADGSVTAGLTVDDDRVYVADESGTMIAMAADSGQAWFTYEIDDAFTTTPTVLPDADATLVGAADGYLHVTDTTFGRRKLRGLLFSKQGVALDGAVRTHPVVAGDVCCVCDETGSLYGIDVSGDAEDCDLRWHFDLDGTVTGTPALADTRLFVGGDERLYCLEWDSDRPNR